MNVVCGLDVSLRNTGVVIMGNNPWEIIHTRCIKTISEHKKRRIYKTDDTIRRIKLIVNELREVLDEYKPTILIAELPVGGGQSANAVEGMAIAKAVVATFSLMYGEDGIPMLGINPVDTKKHLCGKKDASKEEVQEKVVEQFPKLAGDWGSKRSASGFTMDFEHVADAIGAVLTAEDDDMVKLLRSL